MDGSTEVIRIVLLALGLGIAVPVMVQLFLTLRQAQATMKRLEKQIEPALRDVSDVVQRMKGPPPAQAGQALIAALLPAGIAAFQAFRAAMTERESAASPLKSPGPDNEPHPTGEAK